jgi:hypothetical protein
LGTEKGRRSIKYKEDRMPFLSKTCRDYTMERRTHIEHTKGDPEIVKTHESLPSKFEKVLVRLSLCYCFMSDSCSVINFLFSVGRNMLGKLDKVW